MAYRSSHVVRKIELWLSFANVVCLALKKSIKNGHISFMRKQKENDIFYLFIYIQFSNNWYVYQDSNYLVEMDRFHV